MKLSQKAKPSHILIATAIVVIIAIAIAISIIILGSPVDVMEMEAKEQQGRESFPCFSFPTSAAGN